MRLPLYHVGYAAAALYATAMAATNMGLYWIMAAIAVFILWHISWVAAAIVGLILLFWLVPVHSHKWRDHFRQVYSSR
jgi:hypothetical protein